MAGEDSIESKDTTVNDDTQDSTSESLSREDIIGSIQTSLEFGTEDSSDNNTDDVHDDVINRETPVPDAFNDAARLAGFSDDEIVEFAKTRTDDELNELIDLLMEGIDEEEDEEELPTDSDSTSAGRSGTDIDIDDDKLEAVLEAKFGPIMQEIKDFKQQQKDNRDAQVGRRINELFDKATEEFPIFGKTEELPTFPAGRRQGELVPTSPAVKARTEVYDNARVFMEAGKSVDTAMSLAIALYKGQHLEKEVGRKLVKDLKEQETNLSGPRQSKSLTKVYNDKREEIIDEIRQLQRASGG